MSTICEIAIAERQCHRPCHSAYTSHSRRRLARLPRAKATVAGAIHVSVRSGPKQQKPMPTRPSEASISHTTSRRSHRGACSAMVPSSRMPYSRPTAPTVPSARRPR